MDPSTDTRNEGALGMPFLQLKTQNFTLSSTVTGTAFMR
jgi:hypothetical protein